MIGPELQVTCEANDEFDHNGQGSRVIKIEGRGSIFYSKATVP